MDEELLDWAWASAAALALVRMGAVYKGGWYEAEYAGLWVVDGEMVGGGGVSSITMTSRR